MPPTKKKPALASQPHSSAISPVAAAPNCTQPEVLKLSEAAAYLRCTDAEVMRLIHEHGLAARQVGSEWRLLKSAIQDWLRSGSPQPRSNQEAWQSLVGVWKDDPYLEELLKEIYTQRGRPMTEDKA